MTDLQLTHISINALDLEESARFYEELFGMERLHAPNFGEPVLWLRLGDVQLHLFGRETNAPDFHHFGLSVPPERFQQVYLQARERRILDAPFGATVRRHPAGWVQMWMRDPSGNLVEVDCRDADALDESVITDLTNFEDVHRQEGPELTASLFLSSP